MPLSIFDDSHSEMTLDPPGRIAVIGAGPLGLEAAIYGRYLGYDVQVFEQGDVAASLRRIHGPVPMMPDRTVSSLVVGALKANQPSGEPFRYPLTVEQWVSDVLEPLSGFDLLRGRVHTFATVQSIELVEVELDALLPDDADRRDDAYIDGDVPPDYRLMVSGYDSSEIDVEAVIVATGANDKAAIGGLIELVETPYLFCIGSGKQEDAELQLHRGWQEIAAIYARLGGRADLDLYRPRRL